jgi:hypothetical protein
MAVCEGSDSLCSKTTVRVAAAKIKRRESLERAGEKRRVSFGEGTFRPYKNPQESDGEDLSKPNWSRGF